MGSETTNTLRDTLDESGIRASAATGPAVSALLFRLDSADRLSAGRFPTGITPESLKHAHRRCSETRSSPRSCTEAVSSRSGAAARTASPIETRRPRSEKRNSGTARSSWRSRRVARGPESDAPMTPEFHERLRVWCAARDTTIQDFVVKLLERELRAEASRGPRDRRRGRA